MKRSYLFYLIFEIIITKLTQLIKIPHGQGHMRIGAIEAICFHLLLPYRLHLVIVSSVYHYAFFLIKSHVHLEV